MTLGTVAILGPGLIGGSLALGLAERNLADRLVIYARSPRALDEIRTAGVSAELTGNPSEAVREADVVILCVPIDALAGLVHKIRDELRPTTLVTDVGSVKGRIVRELEPLLDKRALWIGSHPMAGSEQAGFAAARADLFQGAAVILTPTRHTQCEAHRRAEQLWRALGARVVHLSPEEHDRHVAQISHLPHLVAAALTSRVTPEALELAGGGFRDVTRIAAASPELWTEILSSNGEAIREHLDQLIHDLQGLKNSLNDPAQKQLLLGTLQAAHAIRSQLPEKRPS